MPSSKRSPIVVQLRVELLEVRPPVWRRLLVPGGVTLGRLHEVLQAAMGWTDSHLHSFDIGDATYGPDDEDADEDELDENAVSVLEALEGAEAFLYEYDFGDGWSHRIVVEATLPQSDPLKHAVCLDGECACPPEDIGGPSGYADFLTAIAHTDEEFDPTRFDVAAANVDLQRIR